MKLDKLNEVFLVNYEDIIQIEGMGPFFASMPRRQIVDYLQRTNKPHISLLKAVRFVDYEIFEKKQENL